VQESFGTAKRGVKNSGQWLNMLKIKFGKTLSRKPIRIIILLAQTCFLLATDFLFCVSVFFVGVIALS